MVEFSVWTKIEQVAPRRYLARAVATPCNVEQRCAPEERSIECPSLESAEAARERLAEALCRDIAARGNRIAEGGAAQPVRRGVRPLARAPRMSAQCAEISG